MPLQMRRAPGCTELIYMFDGDRNGVCWHLGTCGGTQPWVNPVLAGRLQVGWQQCPGRRGVGRCTSAGLRNARSSCAQAPPCEARSPPLWEAQGRPHACWSMPGAQSSGLG